MRIIFPLSQRGGSVRVGFFDDRIEIENPGILPPGMTVEDMRLGVSKIRNPVIARVFRELKLIEQWGSGIPRIFRETAEAGFPEPYLIELGLRVRMVFPLGTFLDVAVKKPATQSGEQVTQQVTQQVKKLLAACVGESTRAELMKATGLKDRVTFTRNYLEPALKESLIEMTQPDSPTSPTQKYRMTEKGKTFLDDGV